MLSARTHPSQRIPFPLARRRMPILLCYGTAKIIIAAGYVLIYALERSTVDTATLVYSFPMSRTKTVEWFFRGALIFILGVIAAHAQTNEIIPPLHTDGHRIVDSEGHTVRLASVNWYGFDEKEY